MTSNDADYQSCFEKARAAGQEHVFRWWSELADGQRQRLLRQVANIDFDLVSELAATYLDAVPEDFNGSIEPADVVSLPHTEEQFAERRRMAALGGDLISMGQVALFIVAGGQGSRLDYDPPKGTFPISPITAKSLFHVFAEKVAALSRRHNVTIPLCVMTSISNNEATSEFFRMHDYFGLGEENVIFAVQEMLPSLDFSGKMILKQKDELFLNPTGHGGAIKALKTSGALDDMRRRGIKYISYHQVDNPLVRSIDPVFIGYHAAAGAEMSLKVLQKRDPEEKLGVAGILDGKLTVIEYSDLPRKLKHEWRPDGSLRYGAGNIAVHILNVDFVERLNQAGCNLPWHVARKAVPFVDDSGKPAAPTEPNAVKFETFVFDALQFARAAVTLETEREEEFAPLKNSEGLDSPRSAEQALTNCYGRWLRQAGVEVPLNDNGDVDGKIEISPLFALDAEELVAKIDPNMKFPGELLLQ